MATPGNPQRRKLIRQATLVLPTGERVRRIVTLRNPEVVGGDAAADGPTETTSLLTETALAKPKHTLPGRLGLWMNESVNAVHEFLETETAHGIIKCSLAYLLATLATFFVPVASLLGTHQDGNQLVANIVVWFNPARSAGSMILGILLGACAFTYGTIIAFSSQGVALFFRSHDLLVLGHVIVLLVFCWGSLGLMAWVKQYANHPTVNTATSLASLAIITCLTREGAIQNGEFSPYRVTQVLKMFAMGIMISSAINLLLWPVSARRKVRQSLMATTDSFAELFATIAASFLAGTEEDLNHPAVVAASARFSTVFDALPNQLAEARYEHYLLGTEREYEIKCRLVECIQRLAEDMGGLRSAAATQFSLLSESGTNKSVKPSKPTVVAKPSSIAELHPPKTRSAPLNIDETLAQRSKPSNPNAIERDPLDPLSPISVHSPSAGSPASRSSMETPAQIFGMFIEHLGPPMKSLAYTLREILKLIPYGDVSDREAGGLSRFRTSLSDAIELYGRARKDALALVYRSKEMQVALSIHVAADFEEVAASCGYFSSSLEDFAETSLNYINIVDELVLEISERPNGRTWRWLKFWRSCYISRLNRGPHDAAQIENATIKVSESSALSTAQTIVREESSSQQPFPYWLYPYFRWFRREDVRFAIKVGGGATIYALIAFIPVTKPYFDHWHLEWGLVSYMLICSMYMGSSNTTSWSRTFGTLLGAVLATVVWVTCRENAIALACCGWMVAVGCFYLILARDRAPMGRFILLTYNLSILYSFALTYEDPDVDEDENFAGVHNQIIEVAFHRFVAVLLGVGGGLLVTHYIWGISARDRVKSGLSLLWLRMGLIWKNGPLKIIEEGSRAPSYMEIRTESELRAYLSRLDSLRAAATSEFRLRGPFPDASYDALMKSTSKMLDSFHALNSIILKDLKASPGEKEILKYTIEERRAVAQRICHMLSVLAASLNMEYDLHDTLPNIEHSRDRLLAKIFQFRQTGRAKEMLTDQDYELLYCYTLVTAQIAHEVQISGNELQKLFDTLGERILKLQ